MLPKDRPFVRAIWNLHLWAYKLSRGWIGSSLVGMPVLMLYSRGRRTGRTRENLLTFISHEDAFLIAGSNGGAVSSPGWYFNLKDEPRTQIRWRGKLIEVSARETRGQERETYWNMFKSSVDSYARYEARTSRLIPVLVLAPIKAN